MQQGFDDAFDGTINRWGLRYRAVGFLPNIFNLVGTAYVESEWGGYHRLEQLINRERARCESDPQKIVLAGYSQGAQVVHDYLYFDEPSDVKAVVLVADPARTTHQTEIRVGGANKTKPGAWAKAMNDTSDLPNLGGRVVSTCHDHDIVCETDWGSNVWTHDDYGAQELRCLGRWAASTVEHGGNQPIPDCGIPPATPTTGLEQERTDSVAGAGVLGQ